MHVSTLQALIFVDCYSNKYKISKLLHCVYEDDYIYNVGMPEVHIFKTNCINCSYWRTKYFTIRLLECMPLNHNIF